MNAPVDPFTATGEALARILRLQRKAFCVERYPDLRTRRDRLERLSRIVTQHESQLVAAVDRDFGHRSSHETRLAELYIVAAEARFAIRHLPAG